MKQYTAIYSTETLKNIQYAFQAVNGNAAKRFCHQKFNNTDIIIRDEETGEEFPLIDGDEVLCKVNEKIIIASDQAMIDAGMIKCNPREGQLTLWAYMLNHVWKEWQWTPIMRVFDKPLTEDLTDEDGNAIEPKSTHKIAGFYGAAVDGNFDITRFLESYNVPVEEL